MRGFEQMLEQKYGKQKKRRQIYPRFFQFDKNQSYLYSPSAAYLNKRKRYC